MTLSIMASSRHVLYTFFSFLSLMLISACGIYETKGSAENESFNQRAPGQNERIAFASVNQQIFKATSGKTCKGCHTDGGSRAGVSLDTYAQVIANLSAIQGTVFNGDPVVMPRGGLSEVQKQILRQWIAQGAPEFVEATPETSSTPAATPTPAPMPSATPAPVLIATYQSIRDNVFAQKCLVCHAPGGRAADLPLDTYAGMMAAGEQLLVPGDAGASKMVDEMARGKMPTARSGLPKVTPEELAVIKTWITNGANP